MFKACLLLVVALSWAAEAKRLKPGEQLNCTGLNADLRREIKLYAPVVEKIISYVVDGPGKGETYNQLAKFVDTFGYRIAGSQNLENAIDYMVNLLDAEGLENVHTEEAEVPHWVRGNELAWLVMPRLKKLNILGLGGSVGTPPGGITAPVLVVKSFDDLKANAAKAKGKIIVFDQDFVSYGVSVQYRDYAAPEAAKVGGVAALVRSITPFSIDSPHTGWMDYEANVTKIPTASITVEDAEMFYRMSQRGLDLVIHLEMEAQNLPNVMSRNTISEIEGAVRPEEVVLVSGHLDSWDVGQGAMDDGGGAFISWRALAVLQQLNYRARRTLRAVLWTGEEEGIWGGQAYFARHKHNANNMNIVMESDIGTFKPLGLSFASSNPTAQCIVQEVLNLMAPINATQLDLESDGPDIQQWIQIGVPGASLYNDNGKYFYFHHSNGDTMTVEDPHTLDLCTAFWAASAFVFADLSEKLPR